jgi:two-component system response regulator DctR
MLHVVDDEEEIRDSLLWLASSRAIAAMAHDSGESFLAALERAPDAEPQGECVLLDVRMPGISGIALFEELNARGIVHLMPVIFMTGHGDVPMAVDILKRGAFDFFEKPFDDNKVMDRVQEALAASRKAITAAMPQKRLLMLSPREREVMQLILAGNINKVIADKLLISTRTVEVHRAHIFEKMNVKTAIELATLLKNS